MSQMTLTDGQIVRLRELVCSLKLPALPSTRHYEDIRMNVFFRALDPARQAFLAREEGETFDRAARRVLQLCLKNELRDLHAGQAVFEQEMSALAELEMADESGKPAFDVADPRTADGVGSVFDELEAHAAFLAWQGAVRAAVDALPGNLRRLARGLADGVPATALAARLGKDRRTLLRWRGELQVRFAALWTQYRALRTLRG